MYNLFTKYEIIYHQWQIQQRWSWNWPNIASLPVIRMLQHSANWWQVFPALYRRAGIKDQKDQRDSQAIIGQDGKHGYYI